MNDGNIEFLEELGALIGARARATDDTGSYTRQLLRAGTRRVAQKVGEEGVELALAGVAGTDESVLDEAADLIYHVLVLLQSRQLSLADVVAVLEQRHRQAS